ncbi:MAG: tRNA 2-thiouridine(34) synthase MnmA [Anaerolineae bacterium]|nr:tRNA 2-thiouridine(34) synthase MnmA [Anaerolineae bacterium]MDH7474899.1 tRNA 2-thiouridine(34) synthase MnmA [Anaerolineae bacterium]
MVVALSGGVDSAVAAAMLLDQGYQVVGTMMRLWAEQDGRSEEASANRCCSSEAVNDAQQVCRLLGIPFHLVNYEQEFKHHVVHTFVAEYARGRTPNPCLYCNRRIKFDLLLRHALSLDAQYLATGHYARIRRNNGEYQLCKGVDPDKDQSYVLYMLGQKELHHLLFPLGNYTKAQVRAIARQRALPVAEKEESQDLCFVLDNDYRRFLRQYAPQTIQPGPIFDSAGRLLGEHKGLPFYTIGQRSGMGIAAPEALYVLEIDPVRNALIVGPASELGRSELIAEEVNYISGHAPSAPLRITAKIRRQAQLAHATLTPLDGSRAHLAFSHLLRDITPGQGVVFYQGDVVLGGGIIG